jgi:BirA family biotin operon repressor/biotin-[acetyl-CoA-carboxylase] ligase
MSFDLARLTAETFVNRVEYLAETRSTNDVAVRRIAEGQLAVPMLVLADRQTAGRGRGANRWWSESGGLTFSLVLQPEQMGLPVERWPRISLVAALAVCSAIEQQLEGEVAQLKWPNDVFCRGRKLCGILLEAPAATAQSPRHLVLGIGLNVNNSWIEVPPELQNVGTALCDLSGRTHDPTDVLVSVLNELELLLAQLAEEDPRLPELWRERSFLTGRHVRVEAGGTVVQGLCVGIDASGALVLETTSGPRTLLGGIVQSYTKD